MGDLHASQEELARAAALVTLSNDVPAVVAQGPPPIPVLHPERDGYIGSVLHADLGASYNQLSMTSPRVIDRIVDELQGMYIAYG